MGAVAQPNEDGDELAALEGRLQQGLRGYMDHAVREWRAALAEVEQRLQLYHSPAERDELQLLVENMRFALASFERADQSRPPHLVERQADRVSWNDLRAELSRDEPAGRALWERIKQAARDELAKGQTAGQAITAYDERLFERAQFLAVRAALADGLHPRNDLEWLLIDGMTQAWVMRQRWLTQHALSASLDAKHVEREAARHGSWEPPRLSEAQAVDRAAMHADRFLRQFVKLMKTYRDGRQLLGAVLMTGGQLNVGEQQLITTRPLAEASSTDAG